MKCSIQVPASTSLPLLSTAASHLVSLLNQCSTLHHIHQAHGFMLPRGLHLDYFLLARFIHACTSLGFSIYAHSVFAHTSKSHPHLYLYNLMIHTLPPKDAIFVFNQIQASGLRPDSYSFPFVLKAVVRLSALQVGQQIHCQIIRTGLCSHVPVVTALIHMYSSSGCASNARKLFDDNINFRDIALWNAMVAGYAKLGDMYNAREVFERMPQRNVISWTTVIAGYAQISQPDEAIAVFRRMQLDDVEPDEIAMLAGLSACAQLGALELGVWIHNYIDNHGLHKTVPLNNALIDMYAKSGNIGTALDVFEAMRHKSVVTWTTMIAGLALHGLGREAFEFFCRMEKARVKPNAITFISILSACGHAGLVEIGRYYFNSMASRYGIQPTIEHYGCMIDLLGRAGYLQEAQELVRVMPFEANGAIWGSLLAASNIHGDTELGERALKHLMKLEPRNSGNYTLLSNIYASVGRWNESGLVRKLMRDTGTKKIPGGSFIEVNNRVQEFISGDISHPQFHIMYDVLLEIHCKLKMAGHLLKECCELHACD